jgi:hypothetical protein
MCSLAALAAGVDGFDVDGVDAADVGVVLVELRSLISRLEGKAARLASRADGLGVWRAAGATSAVDWLAAATQSTRAAAGRSLTLGNVLDAVPEAAVLMDAGEMSVDNAIQLAKVIDDRQFADDRGVLVDIARTATPADTKRAFDTWTHMNQSRESSEEQYARQRAQRSLTFSARDDGLVDVHGVLTRLDAKAVERVVRHRAGTSWDDQTERTLPQRMADALVELADADSKGQVTGGRERPTVLAVVPYDTLVERAGKPGIVDGEVIGAAEIARLLCTADIHRVITGSDSIPIDLGQKRRLASDHQYKLLAARDGGCRWAGCQRPPDWCDAHHIDEVVRNNGPTDLINLALFCNAHHHMLHDRGWTLVGDANDLYIRTPDGTLIPAPARGPLQQLLQLAV